MPLREPLLPTVASVATKASADDKPRVRPRRALVVGLALVVAATAAGAYALLDASPTGTLTAGSPDAGQTVTSDAALLSTSAVSDARVDVGVSSVLDASMPLPPPRTDVMARGSRDAGVQTSRNSDGRPMPDRVAPPQRGAEVIDAGVQAPDALYVAVDPAPSRRGMLAIAPQPDSELTIDGVIHDGGSSFEREVTSGPHEIVITNLRTRKSYRVRADVRPGGRTKCRVENDDELRCR
jgi:hypothetical protein